MDTDIWVQLHFLSKNKIKAYIYIYIYAYCLKPIKTTNYTLILISDLYKQNVHIVP